MKKRNTPVATLLKNYVNKQSGKVSESRKEIRLRFDYLDWKDQKKILQAFLASGKTDRHWAYTKALDNWDPSFEPIIKELWEQLHEVRCSWVVIRYLPEEYLKMHFNQFSAPRDYYFLCRRLAVDKDFVIDREKLSPTDYLAVIYHTGRNITAKEATDILFTIVREECLEKYSEDRRRPLTMISKGKVASLVDFREVSRALYYLMEIGCIDAVSAFEEWYYGIQYIILNSPEYDAINHSDLTPDEYSAAALCIARKYAYIALDDTYKQPTDPNIECVLQTKEWCTESSPSSKEKPSNPTRLNEPEPIDPAALKAMMTKNPALEKLIKEFVD